MSTEPPAVARERSSGFFPQWDELLAACEDWAISQGWRFSRSALLQVCDADSPNHDAQARALPVALEYGDRIQEMQCFTDEPLMSEFRRCQELVAQEAVHNSMIATCRALGLWQEGAPVDEDCAWQDCSQPLEVVVRRLRNHEAQIEAAGLKEKLARRTREASFVTEFGLEYGLPPLQDLTSEATLRDFLQRIKEWDGGKDNEMCATAAPAAACPHPRSDMRPAPRGSVRALVMENLSDRAPPSLRDAVTDWFADEQNQRAALIGGAIFGGVLGLLAAGAAVAASGAAKRGSR